MNRFSLSVKRERALPTTIIVDGISYDIDADFRTQLKILRLLDDPEIANRHKPAMLCALFYGPNSPENGLDAWRDWVQGENTHADPDGPEMSYEYDAADIYASFLMQYGIDLLDEGTRLHWFQFSALLCGLGDDTPFKRTLAIRGLDTSGLKGKAKQKAERAKRNAQLPERVSEEEKRMKDELNRVLMNGGDVSKVLGR